MTPTELLAAYRAIPNGGFAQLTTEQEAGFAIAQCITGRTPAEAASQAMRDIEAHQKANPSCDMKERDRRVWTALRTSLAG